MIRKLHDAITPTELHNFVTLLSRFKSRLFCWISNNVETFFLPVMLSSVNCYVLECQLLCSRVSTVMFSSVNCHVLECQPLCSRVSTVMFSSVNCYVLECQLLCSQVRWVIFHRPYNLHICYSRHRCGSHYVTLTRSDIYFVLFRVTFFLNLIFSYFSLSYDLIVAVNIALICFEVNRAEWFFLAFYVVEIALKLYTYGGNRYFLNFQNW